MKKKEKIKNSIIARWLMIIGVILMTFSIADNKNLIVEDEIKLPSKEVNCLEWLDQYRKSDFKLVDKFDSKYSKMLACYQYGSRSDKNKILNHYFWLKNSYVEHDIKESKVKNREMIRNKIINLSKLCPDNSPAEYIQHIPLIVLFDLQMTEDFRNAIEEKQYSIFDEKTIKNIRNCIHYLYGKLGNTDYSIGLYLYYDDFEFQGKNNEEYIQIESLYKQIYIQFYKLNHLKYLSFPHPKNLLREHAKITGLEKWIYLNSNSHQETAIKYFGSRKNWLNSLNLFISKQ